MNTSLKTLSLRKPIKPYETLDWGFYKVGPIDSSSVSSSKFYYLFDNKVYYLSGEYGSSSLELNYYSMTDDRYYHYIDLPNRFYDSLFVNSYGIMVWSSHNGRTQLCTIVNAQLNELELEGDLVGICDDEVYLAPQVTEFDYNTLMRIRPEKFITSYNIRTGQKKVIWNQVHIVEENQTVILFDSIIAINKDYFVAGATFLSEDGAYNKCGLFSLSDRNFEPVVIESTTKFLFDTRHNEFWIGTQQGTDMKFEKTGVQSLSPSSTMIDFFGNSSITIPTSGPFKLIYFNGREDDVWFGDQFRKIKFDHRRKENYPELSTGGRNSNVLQVYREFVAIEGLLSSQLTFYNKQYLTEVFTVKREMTKAKINSANSVSPTTSRSSRIEVSPPIEVATTYSTTQASTFGFGDTIKTMTYKNVVATGRVEGSGFVVLKGSQIVTSQSQKSCSPKVKAMREEFLRYNPSGILQQDMLFNSSSQAAGFVGGASLSGNANWK